MKNQALFSSKDKSKKLKCRLLQFLFGALRVKVQLMYFYASVVYIVLGVALHSPLRPYVPGCIKHTKGHTSGAPVVSGR